MADPSKGGKTAAQRAFEEEQAKQVAAYYDTVNLLQTDALHQADAAQRQVLDQLKVDSNKKQEKVKVLKEKAMLISAENLSKQELIDSMRDRLSELSAELSRLTLIQARQARMGRTEDDREAALRAVFEATMERAVARRNDGALVRATPQHHTTQQHQVGTAAPPKFTPVYCCPGGEAKASALAQATLRLGRATTFREVSANAARYFGMAPERCLLEDEHHTLWPLDVMVTREIARYRGEQVLRLVHRRDDHEERLKGMASGYDANAAGGEEEDEEELGAGALLKMLGNEGGEGGGGGGEGGEADEAEQQAAMEALAAMGDDESDSDDDNQERKEYVEPPINYWRELRELCMHLTFLGLLIYSTSFKRDVVAANNLYKALETIFVEEEFGDYNEKAFLDVRNFEEVWDWVDGVLTAGLFESDVDETGNIMMYNQLVGAVRLRQMRVSNTSCFLSENVQRRVEVGENRFTQSFVFQARDGDAYVDGGGCFSEYAKEYKATADFGPCTYQGRVKLQNVPGVDVNMYNTSCENSGFEFWDEDRTRAPPEVVRFNDASGYVRDVESDPPPEGRDTPRLPPERWADTINELKSFLWLDEQTRAFIISFSIYNANYNLYTACNFIFELTAGGTIVPTHRFKVFKLELYENVETIDDAMASNEVLLDVAVNLLVLRLAIKELAQYLYIRCNYGTSMPYITNIWNMLEVSNITPFIFAWTVRASFVADQNRILYKAGMFATKYAEIGTTAMSYSLAFSFDSISILTSFMKLFKYFRLVDSFALLWNVLSRAAGDIGFFFFMLTMFLLAFSIFAEQMFGLTLDIYSTTILSLSTLLKMIFGVVDIYNDMLASQNPGVSRYSAIIFFFSYVIWMFFILVNVFLAILNDAYGSVKYEMEEEKAQKRADREERIAAGLEERSQLAARMRSMQRGARSRMDRFQGQLKRIRKRRGQPGQTSTEVIAAAHELGMTLEEVEKLEAEARDYDKRGRPKRRKKKEKQKLK